MVALDDAVDEDGKTALLARAADVHALLERCGIRGDANGVLASRPRFCRRLGSWAEGIERWTGDPREDRGVVMTGLMADSTGVWGSADLPEDALRAQTVAAVAAQLPGAPGDAAGRHGRAGRLPVAAARCSPRTPTPST